MDIQTLRKIRLRAADIVDQGWCQGAVARQENGCATNASNPQAVAWCIYGALLKATHEFQTCLFDHTGIDPTWNDAPGRTAAEVAGWLRTLAGMDHARMER